ncbi:hypothetical protein GGI15_001897 [Coemansia interrupta]|uniref:Galactose oxidase n=1 Tax=Coemansia interrupta TaxID=1126814 RepID=A0A9W8LLN3_9FUNG|nr:hypothetical protein GGI15_001897 [Coemansia interrupta]
MHHVSSSLLAIASLVTFARSSLGLAIPDTAPTDTYTSTQPGTGYIEDPRGWKFSGGMLTVPRSRIAATSVGQLAFFAGGLLENGTYTDTVDIYNKQTNKWSVAHLSSGRSSIGAGSIAGRYAIFAGGLDDSFKPMSIVDVFDAETSKWSTIDLRTPRGSPQIINLGSTTAIVGGLSGDLQYLSNAVDYVDAGLDITNATLQLRYPQFGVAISDKAGGVGLFTAGYQNNDPGNRFNDFEASNQTTVFSITSNSSASFVSDQKFPYPRWGAGGAAANGVFAVGGGHVFGDTSTGSQTTVVDRVDIYSAATGQWSGRPLELSVPRDYPLVQAVGDYIVFVSGTDQSKDFDILDTRSGAFVDNLNHKPALYTLRSDAAATTIDNCMFIVAGGLVYQGRNATASVEMFNACK